MHFQPLSFLKEAVESGNISNTRAAISSYITKNPGNKNRELNEVIKYIANNHLDNKVWEEHSKKTGETQNKSQWTKDYFRIVRSNLRNNFSKERMNHILEVGQYLYKDEIQQKNSEKVVVRCKSTNERGKVDNSGKSKLTLSEKVHATIKVFKNECKIENNEIRIKKNR